MTSEDQLREMVEATITIMMEKAEIVPEQAWTAFLREAPLGLMLLAMVERGVVGVGGDIDMAEAFDDGQEEMRDECSRDD